MIKKREGWAQWSGGLKSGRGQVSTESGAIRDCPYGFTSRFEDQAGTNPEELLGAAHAACFTMALAMILEDAKIKVEELETSASVMIGQMANDFYIKSVHLCLRAKVSGTTSEEFYQFVEKAKTECPISKVLKAEVSIETSLEANEQ